MKVFPDRLDQALARGLAPVYLVAGPERLLVEEACDAIRRTARAHQVVERIRLSADGRFDWNELARSTETGSLFASRRLVELRLATGRPGAEGAKAIRDWLGTDRDDVLLIICDDWAMDQERAAWTRAVEKQGLYMPAWTVKPERLPAWIGQRLKSRGLAADSGVADFLAARLEGNLLAAAQEIDRLAMLFADGRLDLARVEMAVADSARFDAFRLVELVLAGQPGATLRCIRGLRESDAAPPNLIWALARELENVIAVSRMSRRMPIQTAFRELKIWQSRQAAIQSCLNRVGLARIRDAVGRLSDLDRLVKGQLAGEPEPGRGESKANIQRFWLELERLCAGLAGGRALAA